MNDSRRGPRRLARGLQLGLAAGAVGLAVAGELRNRRALADDELSTRPLLRGEPLRCESADGTSLYAEVFEPGSTAALTFVLFPGWTEELHYFDLLTRGLLDRGYRVIACDLRGQGSSGPPVDADQRIERYGEDVDALVRAAAPGAGTRDLVVVGHSMGAMSIAAWAGLASVDVTARVVNAALLNTGMSQLVLASRLLPARLPEALRAAFGMRVVLGGTARYLPVSTPVSRALLRYVAFGPSATAGQLALYEPMLWSCPPQVRAAAGITLSSLDLLAALERLTVPTLVVAGDVDRMTPETHAREMAARLPNLAELLVLPQTGHMAPLERPSEIVEALVRLVSGTKAAAPIAGLG